MRLFAAILTGLALTGTAAQAGESTRLPDRVLILKRNGDVVEKVPGEGFYLGGQVGYAEAEDLGNQRLNSGILGGAVFGYDFGRIRFEADYAYRGLSAPTGQIGFNPFVGFVEITRNVDLHSVLGNAAIDFPLSRRSAFYLLGGAGVTFVDDLGQSEEVLSYQGGGGFNVLVNRGVVLDLGYRYFMTDPLESGEDLQIHNAVFSIRFMF